MAARFRSVLPLWFFVFVCALCLLDVPDAVAQPKREFRAAWIATVSNIDWPSRPGLSAGRQRAEFVAILDQHQQAGLNAVVVQVRSSCDALYPSAIEPWAEVLTGRQGQAPDYDPLAFMIAESHRRGMEFHAWFNPYRAVANTQSGTLHAAHIARKRPDWLLAQGTLRILNPGLPDVRDYVAGVIMDVVRRYDIDGVHFDDYFYPYPPGPGTLPFNDDATFATYGRGFTNRAAWRRDNVNRFVKQMADSLQATKPWVKFGVSPFGIWQNKSAAQPLGSTSRGLQSYSDIYADSRQWIQAGWLDYVAPQLYWNSKQVSANYGQLLPWWSAVVQGSPATAGVNRHLYIGQAAYRVGATGEQATWKIPGHMPAQLRLNRSTVAVQGSIFYNTSTFNRNPLGLRDSLRTVAFYGRPALRPAMPWKHNGPLPAPTQLRAERQGGQVTLQWQMPASGGGELARIRQFAVYRFVEGQVASTEDPTALLAITTSDTTAFVDTNVPEGRVVRYLVTALNRLHTESPASNLVTAAAAEGTDSEPLGFDLRLSPNTVSERVMIDYDLPAECTVRLGIRDASGRAVTQLPDQRQSAGTYSIQFRPNLLPSGVYFVVLQADGHQLTRRMLVAH